VAGFLAGHDYADSTRKAIIQDVRKFARWFTGANNEPFVVARVTVRDVADFRDHARRKLDSEVSTVNRSLVTLRRFFGWLADWMFFWQPKK
jgi:integrase/recombinase XerC